MGPTVCEELGPTVINDVRLPRSNGDAGNWNGHGGHTSDTEQIKRRNDSVLVLLLMRAYRSRLVCGHDAIFLLPFFPVVLTSAGARSIVVKPPPCSGGKITISRTALSGLYVRKGPLLRQLS